MRVVAWFSCGAASAVASSLAIKKYGTACTVVYCDTLATEHQDNARFFQEIERWLGQSITVIRSVKYESVDEIFEQTRYMAGPYGARCTVEMKKVPRFKFQRPDDIHVFGLTVDEPRRIQRLQENNPELNYDWILLDKGLTKKDCFEVLVSAGIALPAMYGLGYRNNNCLGCVKATSARYWNMIRRDFPEVFMRRAAQSRSLGVRLTRYHGQRIFLDQLPRFKFQLDFFMGDLEDVSCGPDCVPTEGGMSDLEASALSGKEEE